VTTIAKQIKAFGSDLIAVLLILITISSLTLATANLLCHYRNIHCNRLPQRHAVLADAVYVQHIEQRHLSL